MFAKSRRSNGISSKDFDDESNEPTISVVDLEAFANDKKDEQIWIKPYISKLVDDVDHLVFWPISKTTWETIGFEGLDEEFNAYNESDWNEAILPINNKIKEKLLKNDSGIIEDFNDFDILLKKKYSMQYIDLIDYEDGIVRIVTKVG